MRSNCASVALTASTIALDRARGTSGRATSAARPLRRRRADAKRRASAREVRHDQRRRKVPARRRRAPPRRRADARASRVLDRLRRDLLAAGRDESFLLAIGDAQVAVARRACRCRPCETSRPASAAAVSVGPVVVARHDVRPAREDLAVVGDPQLRRSAAAGRRCRSASRSSGITRQHRRRLGQAVALEDRQADAVEEPRRGRRRSGALPETAKRSRPPMPLADLLEHEPVGERATAASATATARRPLATARRRGAAPRPSPNRRSGAEARPLRGRARARARAASRTRAARRSSPSAGRCSRSRAIVSIDSAKTIDTPVAR